MLRPDGQVLLGFQSGAGTRDVPWTHDRGIPLERHLYTADDVVDAFQPGGLQEVCRLVRHPRGLERDDQTFLWLQSATGTG